MCNLYLMYYTDAKRGSSYGICADQQEIGAVEKYMPSNSDEPLPPNHLLEEHALHGSTHDQVPALLPTLAPVNMVFITRLYMFYCNNL